MSWPVARISTLACCAPDAGGAIDKPDLALTVPARHFKWKFSSREWYVSFRSDHSLDRIRQEPKDMELRHDRPL